MKTSLATILVLSVFAATTSLATPGADDFRHQAMASDAFEIASSKIALGRSGNAHVKEFAQMMIHDHTLTTEHLLSGTGMTKSDVDAKIAPGADGKHKSNDLIDQSHADTLDKLGSEKGKDFDSDYISAQVSGHKDAVELFTDFAQHGKNRHLRLWARKTLPTLKMHLARAESLNKGM